MQPFILSRRTWGVANWRCPTRESLLMKETSFHICVSINLWRKKKSTEKWSLSAVNFSITQYLVLMIILSVLQGTDYLTQDKSNWLLSFNGANRSSSTPTWSQPTSVRTSILLNESGLHWLCLQMLAFQCILIFLRRSCHDTADSSFMPWAVTYLWPKQNLFPPCKWTDELGCKLQAQQWCCWDTPWILLILSHFSFPLILLVRGWRKQWWE